MEPHSPLGEADFLALRRAQSTRKPVRKAAWIANSSAAVTLVIAVISLPIVMILPSWKSTVAAGALFTIGIIELLGSRRLRRGDPTAATLLGRNQLAFLALIVLYCVAQMATFAARSAQAPVIPAELRGEFDQMPDIAQDLEKELRAWSPIAIYGGYSLIIVLSAGCQGGLALYYFTRRRRLEELQRGTPAWIQRVFNELDA